MSGTKQQQRLQQLKVHNKNTSETNSSNTTNNKLVLQLFDYNSDNNLYISQTHLREPLIENSPEADNRYRRRMAMIHQEVYINTSRSLSTIVDTATRTIRHHIPDDFVNGRMQNQNQNQHQQERDDNDNDYNNEYQMNCNTINNNGRYIDCDEIDINNMNTVTTSTSISGGGNSNGNTRKRSKMLFDEHKQTLSTTITNSSNHLHRILQIPCMKLLPTFHRSRPTSIDTSTTTSTTTTTTTTAEETCGRSTVQQQQQQQQDDFYDDTVEDRNDNNHNDPEDDDYTIPYNKSFDMIPVTISPPPAPRNQRLSDVLTFNNNKNLNLNEISHSVRRFFPSSS